MSSPVDAPEPLWTRQYTLVVLAVFFVFLPYLLFLPVLPVYVLEELHGTVQAAGAVNAVFLLAMFLFRTQTDYLERRYGKRRVMFLAALVFTGTNLLYFFAGGTETLLLLRFLGGASFAIVNTALMALGSQLSPGPRKAEGLAYLATAVTVGSALGPFAGLTLAHWYGFGSVFLFSALISLLGACLSLFLRIPQKASALPGRLFSAQALFDRRAVPASAVALLVMFAISAVLSFVSVYAGSLGLSAASSYFFIVMACCAVLSRLVAGNCYDRFGANAVIYPSIASLALGLFVLGTARTTPGMFWAAALIGLAYGNLVPASQALALKHAPPDRAAVATATFFSFYDVGIGAGCYLVGSCLPYVGYADLYLMLSPFVLCIALIYYLLIHRRPAAQLCSTPASASR